MISQIFQGDIEFKESENASLSVHISAQEEEFERVKVEYNLLNEASIVDIQVVSYTIFCMRITSDCANWLAWYQFSNETYNPFVRVCSGVTDFSDFSCRETSNECLIPLYEACSAITE